MLLKNDGLLPLDQASLGADRRSSARTPRRRGSWAAAARRSTPHYRVSPLEGIRAALAGANRGCARRGLHGNHRLIARVDGPSRSEFFAAPTASGPVVNASDAPTASCSGCDRGRTAVDPRRLLGAAHRQLHARARRRASLRRDLGRARELFVDGELVVDAWDGWPRGRQFLRHRQRRGRGRRSSSRRAAATRVVVDFARRSRREGSACSALRFGVERPLGDEAIAEAAARAAEADVALVFVGRNGEWDSRGQRPARSGAARAAGRAGRARRGGQPAHRRGAADRRAGADAVARRRRRVLQAWYPGQEAGNAIADVLFGDAEPGGRLPQTFPKRLGDNPPHRDPLTYPGQGRARRYREGVFVGYRHYDRAGDRRCSRSASGSATRASTGDRSRLSSPTLGARRFGDGDGGVTNTGPAGERGRAGLRASARGACRAAGERAARVREADARAGRDRGGRP